VLLDGDKIAALAAVYLRQLLSHAPPGTADSIQIGVVQTAYANGASTHFLTDKLGLKVGCTNTGELYHNDTIRIPNRTAPEPLYGPNTALTHVKKSRRE
jgi:phosphomannomutase